MDKKLNRNGKEVFSIWLRGSKYVGTWDMLYPKLRQAIEICYICRIEFKNLEQEGNFYICRNCIGK